VRTAPRSPDRRPTRDEGSVLPLILAFMVIGALIVIPMLNYASTVLRANSVAIQKTETMEQLRAGARVASADPHDLFIRCAGGTVPIPVAGALVPGTTSTCRQVSSVTVLEKLEVPYGATAMQLGESVPSVFSNPIAAPTTAENATSTDWYGDPYDTTTCAVGSWCPEPKQDTIWLPPLPEVATSLQEATGHPMPAPRVCTVYFPGTYDDEVVVDGPAYFVSGVYLFNDGLTVVGGADAVLGFGLAEGCVGNDSAAVLDMYPNPLPPDLNAEGNGATLIFADEAQLVIDDTITTDGSGNIVANTAGGALRFEINQRYIKDVSDTAARVSIMTVNGDKDVDETTDPDTITYGELDVPDVLRIAESVVQTSTGALELASVKGLEPSALTPEPRAPQTPANVVAIALDDDLTNPVGKGATLVSWDPPVGNDEGGSTITRYEVTEINDPTLSCSTDGRTECAIRDLDHDVVYQFEVTATNAIGTSEPSLPVSVSTSGPDPLIGPPTEPQNVVVADPATAATVYDQAVEVSWDPPLDDGNAVLAGYRVAAYPAYELDTAGVVTQEFDLTTPVATCETGAFRNDEAPTSCVVEGLPPLDTNPGAGPISDLTDPLNPITSTWTGYVVAVTAATAVTNEGLPGTIPPETWSGWIGTAGTDPTTTPVQTVANGNAHPVPDPPEWPVAPTYVPEPVVDVDLSGAAADSKVTIAGYMAVPQGRLRVNNPDAETVTLDGGVVAAAFDVDATTLSAMTSPYAETIIGFEDVVLQRTVEIVTRIPGERATSTIRAQINANAADMAINSWVIQ
jgi:hypothetical protein